MPLRRPGSWPVAEVAASVDAPVPGAEASRALGLWLDTLVDWNAKIDLTAAKDARALAWLMLADAMVVARAMPVDAAGGAVAAGEAVIDVGTGAGAPGLALAILRPELRVTLCEPLGKRAAFLRTVVGTLRRADIAIDPKRVDAVEGGRFDAAISRATLAPEVWLAEGVRLVRPGGSVWVMLAQDAAPTHPRAAATETIAYVDETTGANRRLVRYVAGAA